VEAPMGDFNMSNGYHVSCFKIPRKLSISVEEFFDDYLTNRCDVEDLKDTRKDDILNGLHQAALAKKKTPKKASGGDEKHATTIMSRLKAAAKAGDGDDDGENEPSKKRLKRDDDEKEFQDLLLLYKRYHKKALPELKDYLRWNNQIVGGTKDFVLFKVIDGEL
jgi:hypothetical protein